MTWFGYVFVAMMLYSLAAAFVKVATEGRSAPYTYGKLAVTLAEDAFLVGGSLLVGTKHYGDVATLTWFGVLVIGISVMNSCTASYKVAVHYGSTWAYEPSMLVTAFFLYGGAILGALTVGTLA